jgi:hypothetical protein
MAFVHLSDLKDYDTLSTVSHSTVSSGFRVKDPKKLPRLNDRWSCVTCSGFTVTGRPCKNSTLNRSGFCQAHETPEVKSAAFLLMCDEALEALEEFPKIPEIVKEIPTATPEIVKEIPTATPEIVKEIPTTTPVNQVHIHYNLSGLMKQINIFIVLCFLSVAMYNSMQPSSDVVCLPAPPVPPSASVMYLK